MERRPIERQAECHCGSLKVTATGAVGGSSSMCTNRSGGYGGDGRVMVSATGTVTVSTSPAAYVP